MCNSCRNVHGLIRAGTMRAQPLQAYLNTNPPVCYEADNTVDIFFFVNYRGFWMEEVLREHL